VLKEKRPAFRTIEGWAISILLEAGAICECEEDGWMKDRTDPQARQRAIEIARQYPPLTVSLAHATAAVESLLGSIGDTCPECPPEDGYTQALFRATCPIRTHGEAFHPKPEKPALLQSSE
jgi:hypothetical protein